MRSIYLGPLAGLAVCALALQFPTEGAAKERVVHSFGSGTDGQSPYAGLINVKGTLYGTTHAGGAYGYGTVFAFDRTTGSETVLYSFCSQQNCTDGEYPYGSLINAKGTLYGTTSDGGTYGEGAVFALDPTTGAETVVYSFCVKGGDCLDGALPHAGLIDVKGVLYGTTSTGGSGPGSAGTVFALDPNTGEEKVLYTFQGRGDGANPAASLIDVNGTLYGTTQYGGIPEGEVCPTGCGTVFSLNPNTEVEQVIYAFCDGGDCYDGQQPVSSLIYLNGTLFGTTYGGGYESNGCAGDTCGTVFGIDPNSGAETLLYEFGGVPDGANPAAGLIDVSGTLYGTTQYGGTKNCTQSCGTVFSINPTTGAETVVYSFCNRQFCTDGTNPIAGLLGVKGKLYGTTLDGGAYNGGTVFLLKNP